MNIILGVTGSIAAYKTPWLVRDLRRAGHDVRVILTPSARAFVAPLALEAASSQRVIIDPYEPEIQEGGSWHVHMAQWADLMLIAPCSAATLSKIANGLCDNALLTVAFSLPKTTLLIVAPAMDSDMWTNAATQRNIQTMTNDGVVVLPPVDGPLASGLSGPGRLPEIEAIIEIVNRHEVPSSRVPSSTVPSSEGLSSEVPSSTVAGKRIVITAGPTHEPIDAVRSIVNHSTGTMGFAIAAAAQQRGMLVTLISGPVSLSTPVGVDRIDVTTAAEMFDAVKQHMQADVIVMAAAVADYTPTQPVVGKIKKGASSSDTMSIELRKTDDILSYIGKHKPANCTIVGFALEYENVIQYAKSKLIDKNADIIVANQAGIPRSGFGAADNTITIIKRPLTIDPLTIGYPPMSKRACAEIILDHIAESMQHSTSELS